MKVIFEKYQENKKKIQNASKLSISEAYELVDQMGGETSKLLYSEDVINYAGTEGPLETPDFDSKDDVRELYYQLKDIEALRKELFEVTQSMSAFWNRDNYSID